MIIIIANQLYKLYKDENVAKDWNIVIGDYSNKLITIKRKKKAKTITQ